MDYFILTLWTGPSSIEGVSFLFLVLPFSFIEIPTFNASNVDSDQTTHSGSTLFANVPFYGTIGLNGLTIQIHFFLTIRNICVTDMPDRRTCSITKTCLYNVDPLRLGFTGVYMTSLISAKEHRLWYSLEPPRRGGSNECTQSMF